MGTTTTVSGEMIGGPDLSSVRGWVEAPVRTLKTGNDHRDRDLNKSMETDKYPTMRFELTSLAPGQSSGDSIPITLGGNLLLHGVKRPVELPGWVRLGNNQAHLHSNFPLNVKDYKVGGLSKFFGLFKMNPNITVHVNLTFLLPLTLRTKKASVSIPHASRVAIGSFSYPGFVTRSVTVMTWPGEIKIPLTRKSQRGRDIESGPG